MKVRFKTTLSGVEIDETVDGATAENVVRLLRERIADKTVKKGIFKFRIGNFLHGLDPREKNAWTDEMFFKQITDYYNEHLLKENEAHIGCPVSCEEFLDLCKRLGLAEEV